MSAIHLATRWWVLTVATFFGIGYITKAPGTVASIIALLIACYLSPILLFYSCVTASLIGILTSQAASRALNTEDASQVVIDEVAGMWLGLLFVPKHLLAYIAVLLVFRFLDIRKPYIIGIVNARVKGGLGIMLDDWLAGFFSGLSIWLLITIGQYCADILRNS